jgi:5,10-methylene-tetrahydrofolate dehydrogenase/methenyl tetrahydrofolate cyclohydrolase
MAAVIDGKAIAATVRGEIRAAVGRLSRPPGLAVIIVGDRPDSAQYVAMKEAACKEVGFHSEVHRLAAETPEAELLALIDRLNGDALIDGVLVQLPLPAHMEEKRVVSRVSPAKDVDGFSSVHIGDLALKGHTPAFVSCTPKGCLELLKRSGVAIAGKHAVVLGRSNIVGLPVSLLLLHESATLTVCHSRTPNIPEIVSQADILVAAIGKPHFVKGAWLKPGCAVIDVGINQVEDKTKKSGFRMVGDVDYDEAVKVAGHITPVPGGVGPMTIAMLLSNTLDACVRATQH